MEEKQLDSKLEESETIELDKVLLRRSWSIWETYEARKSGKGYSESLEEIYTFDNIISFWQFWNKYPGNDIRKIFYDGENIKYFFKEKYRIIAMNIFETGIKPEWEDKKNQEGSILTLEYIIDKDLNQFLSIANDLWINLISILIGETIPFSNNVNGIRFVDKTKINKSVIFKFEIWASKLMKEEELEKIKLDLSKSFGCKGTIKKIKI